MFSAPPSPEQSKDSGIQIEPEAKRTSEQKDKENTMLPPAANNIPRRESSSREQTPKGKIGTGIFLLRFVSSQIYLINSVKLKYTIIHNNMMFL